MRARQKKGLRMPLLSPTGKLAKATFWLVRNGVKLFYPRIRLEGWENVPDEPCFLVGNHCKMNGPIIAELYIPGNRAIWCAGEMMHAKDVPAYAYQDFWSHKPKWQRPFFKLASYLIAPISVSVFNNAHTIGVYHDSRSITTFRHTVSAIANGAKVVIFPEHDADYNHILCDFQEKFVDVAKLCYKRTGKLPSFVPMYLAPNIKTAFFGKPIPYPADLPAEEARKAVCQYLMEEITALAVSAPPHTVIPYRNLPRKDHPCNTIQ